MLRLITIALFALTLSCFKVTAQVPYAPGKGPADQPGLVAERIAAQHTIKNFLPSLEAREAADFLLTPALLVRNLKLKQPVQFDAVIMLNRQISPSDVTLFARYWVASNAYSIGIVWAEPHGRFLDFAAYPPSLRIISSETEFRIDHSLFTNAVGSFTKPIAAQHAFTNQFGDYVITSIRFAEDRMSNSPWLSAHNPNGGAHVQHGIIPEMPVRLGLAGDGARIGIGGTNYLVNEISGVDLRGSRTYDIAWASGGSKFGGISVPQSIAIGLTNGTRLYRAKLGDIRRASATRDNDRFAAFSEVDLLYRALLDRYWKKPPEEVTAEDRAEAKKLIDRYVFSGRPEHCTGEKLKRLNILMELNRMIGDEEAHVRYFRKYLAELKGHGMDETMLLGGQIAVDTLMIWKRPREAKRLMEVWAEFAQNVQPGLIIAFAERDLKRDNLVTTLFLLQATRASAPQQLKGRWDDLRATAVRKLGALAADAQLCESSEVAAGQIDLAKQVLDLTALKQPN